MVAKDERIIDAKDGRKEETRKESQETCAGGVV